ncbi:MAG: NfeD family protein [Bryobacteraceae bacterium]|nr:NfeD family protein [Bryobacteraceae bacterium]MCX7602571.1 NfeD family protein [Bryobacteraceae bacterium]
MEEFSVAWWAWIVLGLVLLAGEVLTPGGFYIFFFGASAVCVGLLKLMGFTQGLVSEGLLFVGLSIAGVAFLRRPLLEKFRPPATDLPDADRLAGETAIAVHAIPPGGFGKVELRGSMWNAMNEGDTAIGESERCRVVRVEGLTLRVRRP